MEGLSDNIFVKSFVARDLLQNAGLFKTDKLVVWEYVSNSLQYVDRGTSPVVRVSLDSKRKRIIVADNGSLPTEFGEFSIIGYRSLTSNEEFVALARGDLEGIENDQVIVSHKRRRDEPRDAADDEPR